MTPWTEQPLQTSPGAPTTRGLRIVLPVLGVVALVAAAVLRFVIVPGQAQWPADVDSTRNYEGTLTVLLNGDALAAGDLANLFVTDVPVAIERHVTTESVDGDRALVRDASEVTGPDGSVLFTSDTTYGIDRKTMEAVDRVGDTTLPERTGLVLGWPIGSEARDYEGWSDEIGTSSTAVFEGQEERAGLTTYKYHASISNAVIVDEGTLSDLPAALPKDLVGQLLPALGDASLAERFAQMADSLPDPIPLAYLYSSDLTLWVEPATGIAVDLERTESRTIAVQVGVLNVPVTEVFAWEYSQTDASVARAVEEAEDAKAQLTLFGTTLPIALAALGVLLLLATVFVGRRGSRPDPIDADREPVQLS